MSEVWSVPGYELQALVGSGATGEVWRARQLATGRPVAVRRLRPGLDAAAVAAVQREAALVTALDTPYVVRLHEVVDVGDGLALVTDWAGGGSLATLLARRSCLDAGEVVTVGGPLAQALAAAHALGLSCSGLTAADVLFTADGMPQLSDLGLRRLLGEPAGRTGESGPAADVRSLAALCHRMLTGTPPDGHGAGSQRAAGAGGGAPLAALAPTAPPALVAAVEAALVAGPAKPPSAAAFAELLRRACAPAPVQLTAGAAVSGGPAAGSSAAGTSAGDSSGGSWSAGDSSAEVPSPGASSTGSRRMPRGREVPGGRAAAAMRISLRRPARQPVLLGTVLVLLVAAAGTVGWLSGRSAAGPGALPPLPPATTPAPSAADRGPAPAPSAGQVPAPAPSVGQVPAPAPSVAGQVPDAAPDWASLLDRLDGARARAFAEGDVAALVDVYAAGSPGLASDTALVEALAGRQQTATGVRHSVQSVEVLASTARTARLRVVDVLAGYAVRGAGGEVVSRAPERGPTPFLVELVRVDDQWRLLEVRPASG